MTQQTRSRQEALAAIAPFAQLAPAQLDQIARLSDERHIRAGDELCHQHDFGSDVFVIGCGNVTVLVDGVEVARRGPGEMVGDWALFGDGFRSATLRAATDVDVLVVDPREIDSLLMAVPAAAGAFGPHALVH